MFLGSVRGITPTRITVVGALVKIAAIAFVFTGQVSAVAFAITLQVAQVLDSMDGTLARHRGVSSSLGAYLDKVLDAVTLVLLLLAVGVRARHETGDEAMLLYAAAAASAFVVGCYALWVSRAVAPAVSPAPLDGAAPVLSSSEVWAEWGRGWWRVGLFQEADLYFWIALGALLQRWEWLCVGLAVTQVVKCVGVCAHHGVVAARHDTAKQG
jgi:phosphatidylglycerophosphate synthase